MMLGILKRDARYQLATQEEDVGFSEQELKLSTGTVEGARTSTISLLSDSRHFTWLPWLFVVILALSNFHMWKLRQEYDPSQAVFCTSKHLYTLFSRSNPNRSCIAPAWSAIRYKNVVSTTAIGNDRSPYQGQPTSENNQLWTDLYNCKTASELFLVNRVHVHSHVLIPTVGVSRIPMSDAAQLANRTVPIADDPGHYAVTLDVFHELHCLVGGTSIHRRWSRSSPLPTTSMLSHT